MELKISLARLRSRIENNGLIVFTSEFLTMGVFGNAFDSLAWKALSFRPLEA
jgi:hypothetical protein